MRNVGDFHDGASVEQTPSKRSYVRRGIEASSNAEYHRKYRAARRAEAEQQAQRLGAYQELLRRNGIANPNA